MVLQAYLDESVDRTGVFVLAGYIASAEQWASFSEEWEKMLPMAVRNKDGQYRFKMSEMARSPERIGRVAAFHNIIQRHIECSIAIVFNLHDIPKAMARVEVIDPPNLEIDFSSYAEPIKYAVYALLDLLHRVRLERPDDLPLDGPVDFYFDNTNLRQIILDGWETFSQSFPDSWSSFIGSTPRFEDDEKFLPLQAADFRAWWVRKWAVESGISTYTQGEYGFPVTYNPRQGLVIQQDQDHITQYLLNLIRSQLPDVIIRDNKPVERVDPPFPVERLAAFFGGILRKRLGRRNANE